MSDPPSFNVIDNVIRFENTIKYLGMTIHAEVKKKRLQLSKE